MGSLALCKAARMQNRIGRSCVVLITQYGAHNDRHSGGINQGTQEPMRNGQPRGVRKCTMYAAPAFLNCFLKISHWKQLGWA